MTEKEKMISGEFYNANDAQLVNDRDKCKEICFLYNRLMPHQKADKIEIIKNLVGSIGKNFLFEPDIWFDYGYNIEIGDNFYANHNLIILDSMLVKFGDNVFLGPNCNFYSVNHPFLPEERNMGLEYALPITVGNNVWLGGNVTVMPGVTIGNNSVIGGGSIVVKDIPDNVLAVGNPCKVIRTLNNA